MSHLLSIFYPFTMAIAMKKNFFIWFYQFSEEIFTQNIQQQPVGIAPRQSMTTDQNYQCLSHLLRQSLVPNQLTTHSAFKCHLLRNFGMSFGLFSTSYATLIFLERIQTINPRSHEILSKKCDFVSIFNQVSFNDVECIVWVHHFLSWLKEIQCLSGQTNRAYSQHEKLNFCSSPSSGA